MLLLTHPQGLGAAKRTANQLTIPDLVRALRQIDPHKRVLAFRLLEKDKAIAVFEALTPDEQATLTEGMTDPEILHFLEALEADQRVRLFEELPAKVTQRLLSQLSPQSRDAVNLLLGYPEGTIGRRMNLRYLALRQQLTVGEAIASIRESSLDDLSIIFVIDEQCFYRGF
ncbi:MAG TPA: magnesium transporter, partial [Thermosynechococcus sp. M46_R2017_013]|nr:magnesium transporter [Thermosynechococcus sp. M46_R2017_013]